jgi:hypothetical protein
VKLLQHHNKVPFLERDATLGLYQFGYAVGGFNSLVRREQIG